MVARVVPRAKLATGDVSLVVAVKAGDTAAVTELAPRYRND